MIEFARLGINCLPAENDQLAGTQRVKTFLQNRKMWFVEKKVPRTIMQMLSLKTAPARTDEQNRGKLVVWKKNDELPDCVRYIAAIHPEPVIPKKEEVTDRDLSQFPPHVQAEIIRIRKYDQAMEMVDNVADDFWA